MSDAPLGAGGGGATAARIALLLGAALLGLSLLAVRAGMLAFAGAPAESERHASPAPIRAELVDRNGVLLATTTRAFALIAEPRRVWDPEETAGRLLSVFPDLDRATLVRRLSAQRLEAVTLRRGLTLGDREAVRALGLAGLRFEVEDRRFYPQGALAGHVLGRTDRDLRPIAGAELGLQQTIAAHADGRVALSLDVRVQYAAEQELAAAAEATRASSGAAIVLDGRTGETLALASWPSVNPNRPIRAGESPARNVAVNSRFEMGSTMKAFTVAAALDLGLTHTGEQFNLAAPMEVDGVPIVDFEPAPQPARLEDILVFSSNRGAARLALRIGARRQRALFERLGLLSAAPLELVESAAPLAPATQSRVDVAAHGFGYAFAVTPAALAGAYTVFCNQGARVRPTLLARMQGSQAVETIPVFSARATAETLTMLRAVVTRGTARAADRPGLALAGKTGTAERLGANAAYDENRNFASFAAIFPAFEPRYVIVLTLDEPQRTPATGGRATGGAVAAGPVGRIAERIAPFVGLRVQREQPAAGGRE